MLRSIQQPSAVDDFDLSANTAQALTVSCSGMLVIEPVGAICEFDFVTADGAATGAVTGFRVPDGQAYATPVVASPSHPVSIAVYSSGTPSVRWHMQPVVG